MTRDAVVLVLAWVAVGWWGPRALARPWAGGLSPRSGGPAGSGGGTPPLSRTLVLAGCLGGVGGLVLGAPPLLALGPAVAVWERLRGRRAAEEEQRLRAEAVPVLCELVVVALGSGAGLRQALECVARSEPGPAGRWAGSVVDRLASGRDWEEALSLLSAEVPECAGFAAASVAAIRSGGPAMAPLAAHADHETAVAYQRRLERVRSVPTRLVIPLVFCVLPAFLLAAMVPLVVAVVGGLDLPEMPGGHAGRPSPVTVTTAPPSPPGGSP